jgi:peptidoglycan/xylan/chitin deacetylase (PgdA/CDA1 family)
MTKRHALLPLLRTLFSKRSIVVFLMLLVTVTIHSYATASSNLIVNHSFESGAVNSPTSWNKVNWGNHSAAFSTPIQNAQEGSRLSRVSITNYVSGDARWNAPSVSVTPGDTYTMSHWYKSDTTTQVNAEVIMADNSRKYLWLGTYSPTSIWKQSSVSLTAPAGAKQANIYHLISSNGWLETDNYSMYNSSVTPPTPPPTPTPTPTPTPPPLPVPTPVPTSNLISNPSLESGSTSTATNWSSNAWGNLTAKYTLISSQSQDGSRAARVDVSQYTQGDAKWYFDSVAVTGNSRYQFTNHHRSNVPTVLTAAFTMQDGTVRYTWLKNIPTASSWAQNNHTITTPAGTQRMTVFHLIATTGWLEVDNYKLEDLSIMQPPTPSEQAFSKPLVSIEFDDGWGSAYRLGLPAVESYGWKPTQYIITNTAINNSSYGAGTYMTPNEIKDWNRRGDIGSHSVTHAHVPALPTTQITAQLTDSKQYLDTLLGEPTNLYVSPYCESSQTVVDIAKTLYKSVRNCQARANTRANFDRWNLSSFIILNTTTDAEIRAALSDAKASNGWLILVWHEIDGDNKNPWSVSQATLKRQLQIVKESGIEVTTTQSALDRSTR